MNLTLKTVCALSLMILVAGCEGRIGAKDIEVARSTCSKNGGLNDVTVFVGVPPRVSAARCVDGAEFKSSSFKTAELTQEKNNHGTSNFPQ